MSFETRGRPRRGRGALSNREGRFERQRLVPPDDINEMFEEELPRLVTTVTPESTRTIITTNDSPDIPFDRSINPYKGCEHGCVYCFARPTHSYLGLSPGLDFESRLFSKPDAARLLRRELRRPGYRCEPIALGSNTDPYQPIERHLRITRDILRVLAEHRHPATIVTKSDNVLRDVDLLRPMARARLVSVMISITTLDRRLARRMEPRAVMPERRLATIRALREEGIPVGVLASPMIPALNDAELEAILKAAAAAGALSAAYLLLRLPHELKELFTEWLESNYPRRSRRVLSLIRQMRGGCLNDGRFGRRMRGGGPHAEMLRRRFEVACRRAGLNGRSEPLDTTRFRVPAGPGDQLRLFDSRAKESRSGPRP